jgi:Flp pilus assembly protein TadD
MENSLRRSFSTELAKRGGLSEEEVKAIYALGRLFLESGSFVRAATILKGLNELAPDFIPAYLGLGYIYLVNGEFSQAVAQSTQVLRREPANPEGMLMNVIGSLCTGDINSAGTYLGELKDLIEAGTVLNPQLVRLYRLQLVRFQSR